MFVVIVEKNLATEACRMLHLMLAVCQISAETQSG